ncbi:MAG: ATP-binding cassette domain-containing protein, partial [Gemmiger sp.]
MALLEVSNLGIAFGGLQAVAQLDLSIEKGHLYGLIGPNGAGKTTVFNMLTGVYKPTEGNIVLDGVDITAYRPRDMERLRGKLFSMVFQDPMTSLNPTIAIGEQIAEAVRVHNRRLSRDAVHRRVIELMELVGIDAPESRYGLYPYNFSGGMRQRSVLAIALASNPRILFADEPTTALDVTIQAQILDLLRDIQKKLGT